ncbi:MAG TPA: IS4 family transposase [Candidatus Paraprevotella stercorigallinarum]|nr:IS4 family transposase [Candidatus Paraprevotella stercorigallinarum]
MNTGRYIFSQMVDFLPKRKFERMIDKRTKVGIPDPTLGWQLSYWNQLLVLMFGQLDGYRSLRELTDITTAHKEKSFHLGFGKSGVNRSILSRCNSYRDWHVFEEFAYYMISLAQDARIGREFCIKGKYYAFDSSTIDLCMGVFKWANFRSTKAGIKIHTQFDIVTQIPRMVHVTEAKVHDVNAMDMIEYEPRAGYIFDCGYWDLKRLYRINQLDAFFAIREKRHPGYIVESGIDFDDKSNVLRDETVRFTGKRNIENYPGKIRRIIAYIPDLHRTFTFYTNNFILSAEEIVFLYKNRWQVELFFKWIKQHLRVTAFWGQSENAVRIQIYTAICTYCLVAIIEHELNIERNIYEIMRVMGSSLLVKGDMARLFLALENEPEQITNCQLTIDFESD